MLEHDVKSAHNGLMKRVGVIHFSVIPLLASAGFVLGVVLAQIFGVALDVLYF